MCTCCVWNSRWAGNGLAGQKGALQQTCCHQQPLAHLKPALQYCTEGPVISVRCLLNESNGPRSEGPLIFNEHLLR
jgi:hypothetical protein